MNIRAWHDGKEITKHESNQLQEIENYINGNKYMNIDISGNDENSVSMMPRENTGDKHCIINIWEVSELYGTFDMNYFDVKEVAEYILYGFIRKSRKFDFEIIK